MALPFALEYYVGVPDWALGWLPLGWDRFWKISLFEFSRMYAFIQALRLSSEVYGGYVKVEEYSHGHHMKVVYWRPGSDQLLSAFLLDNSESESLMRRCGFLTYMYHPTHFVTLVT